MSGFARHARYARQDSRAAGFSNRSAVAPEMAMFARWGRVSRGWSDNTAYCYAGRVVFAQRWMRDNRDGRDLADATPADLELMMLDTGNESPSWRNGFHAALRAYYGYLRLVHPDQPDPTDNVSRVRVRPPVPRALDRETARRVMDTAKEIGGMVSAMTALLLYGALRRAEMQRLTWADVEGDGQWLRVLGKGGDERMVPLHQVARQELLRWRAQQDNVDPSAWLFPSPQTRDRPLSSTSISKWMHAVGDAAGVTLTPHVCRHTAATRMVEQGVDVRTLQAVLGHRSLQATQVYLRARPERAQAAVAALDF